MKKVAVIMGSDSDWPVVKGACQQLAAFGIPYEAHILSAHRTPAEAADFAKNARSNGFGVLICAAGMAAHLAGAFAGNSTLPVIGIPMKGGAMDGLDALLATVQMPGGIPVATVAINGAKNAAVLAAQILAVSDDALAAKLDTAREDMAKQIAEKEAKLQAELAQYPLTPRLPSAAYRRKYDKTIRSIQPWVVFLERSPRGIACLTSFSAWTTTPIWAPAGGVWPSTTR